MLHRIKNMQYCVFFHVFVLNDRQKLNFQIVVDKYASRIKYLCKRYIHKCTLLFANTRLVVVRWFLIYLQYSTPVFHSQNNVMIAISRLSNLITFIDVCILTFHLLGHLMTPDRYFQMCTQFIKSKTTVTLFFTIDLEQ